jgi:hypothetical protein
MPESPEGGPARHPFRSPVYWGVFAAGLAWTIVMWARAAPLHSVVDDEIGHFVIARDVWTHPALLLNAWGRVGNTALFAIPAAIGLEAARAFALAMSAATVLVTTQVARVIGVRALALVPAFLWFQPWFHLYGNAVLAEVPFTLVMVAACWAALAEREVVASLLFGSLPLIRHEGLVVLGLWMAFVLVRRRFLPLALSALPLLVYQALFAVVYSKAPFSMYFHTTPTTSYGHGGWLHYLVPLGRNIGPPIALLAVAGFVIGRRNRRLLMLAAPYALYGLAEVVIFRFGLFGSGGDLRYMLPLAPVAAVGAAVAGDRLLSVSREGLRAGMAPARAAAAAVALLGIFTLAWAARTTPARADRAAAPMRDAVRFLRARGAAMSSVAATHVWFYELSGAAVPRGDGVHSPWSRPTRPQRLRSGATAVWDCFYSNRFGLRWRRLGTAGFHELAGFGGGRVVVLRRAGSGSRLRRAPPCRSKVGQGLAPG